VKVGLFNEEDQGITSEYSLLRRNLQLRGRRLRIFNNLKPQNLMACSSRNKIKMTNLETTT
jgi:hypothetical protein